MIRFLLDNEEIALGDETAPDLTVLDWLRLYQRRTGTKEGCGSGDCGACTVVVAEPDQHDQVNALQYKAINSCITFVGALHGKQLLTVESLADGGQLHPVQAAMVGEHGSQCGFCTPGFVMSLYALYQSVDAPVINADRPSPAEENAVSVNAATQGPDQSPSKDVSHWHAEVSDIDLDALSHRIDRTLGGNLCRCTGYRPIKRAAVVALAAKQRAATEQEASWSDAQHRQQQIAERLIKLSATEPQTCHFKQPRSIRQFAELYAANPDAHILAGGTDLALEVTQRLKTLTPIISTTSVTEMLAIDDHGDEWQVGAAVSLNRCLDLFRHAIPTADTLLLRFGSDQVRNQGTIGGNIGSASPIGDLPPMLLALDARLQLQQGGSTREVPLSEYFLDYRKTVLQAGEFIRSVFIPKPSPADRFAIYKVSKRMEDDISSVCAAFHLVMDGDAIKDARIAYGGMAAIPLRVSAAETSLQGARFNEAAVNQAQSAITDTLNPIDDARASARYRLTVAANLLQRFWLESDNMTLSQVSDVAHLVASNSHG